MENLEKSNDGKITLSLRITGNSDKVMDTIKKTKGVSNAEYGGKISDDTSEYTAVLDNENARAELLKEISSKGFSILEIQTVKKSLEDIFVKITQGK